MVIQISIKYNYICSVVQVRSSAKPTIFKPTKTIAERVLSDETGQDDVLRLPTQLLQR